MKKQEKASYTIFLFSLAKKDYININNVAFKAKNNHTPFFNSKSCFNMLAKTNFQDFNANLKKKYIELLKKEGYVFSEVVLKEMFTKDEIQTLLLTNFIEPIYKVIYVATTTTKT